MPRMLFHRDFVEYTGGHGKVWDYFRHALALGWQAQVYLTPRSLRSACNPWMQMPERIVPEWNPQACDLLFLAGMDWASLATPLAPPRPVVNLLQSVRHAWQGHPLRGFLSAPAHRICVSQPVADAVAATGQVNGALSVIPAALDVPAGLGGAWPGARARILVAGLKAPQLARALAAELEAASLQVDLLDAWMPRDRYLQRVAAAMALVALPLPAEGFYLPALEAMALGTPVVTLDCIGSRQYARSGENCLIAAPTVEDLAAAVRRSLQPEVARGLIRQGTLTAAAFAMERERRSFMDVLQAVVGMRA